MSAHFLICGAPPSYWLAEARFPSAIVCVHNMYTIIWCDKSDRWLLGVKTMIDTHLMILVPFSLSGTDG